MVGLQAATPADAIAAITAVNGLTSPATPVTIQINLGSGTFTDVPANVPLNVTLILNGNGGTTIVGHSPALTVSGGKVIVENVTFSTPTDAPTILVTGGSLTLRDDTIQESTGGTDAAISITGGTLDLGTPTCPGGNTININGTGEFIHNTTGNAISAVGTRSRLTTQLRLRHSSPLQPWVPQPRPRSPGNS